MKLLESHYLDIVKCTRCGNCRLECPSYEGGGWESKSARGRMVLAKGLMEGLDATPSLQDSLFTCTSCRACTEVCPSGASPHSVVEDVRGELWRMGVKPPQGESMLTKISDQGNPLGESGERLAWAEGMDYPEKPDAVMFTGCMASYRYPDVARAWLRLMAPMGVAPLEGEKCCGSPLVRMGAENKHLEENSRLIRESGAELVVSPCAGCARTLRENYDLDVEVRHAVEFMAERVDDLPLKRLPYTVTLHDSCHIGREFGVYEQPRRIIEKVAELVEMPDNRSNSLCCGGGGGVRANYPDLSLRMAKKRVEQVPTEADYIVTTCPLCQRNLLDAGGDVMDIAVMLCEAMNGK